jgi:hypothetical protein
MGWTEIQSHFAKQFFHTLKIVITIFFHASLFVLWIALDMGAGALVHLLGEHGFHEQLAYAFRFLASVGIFCVAVAPAMSDVIEIIGIIWAKIFVSLNLACRTCPARRAGEESAV